MKNRKILFGPKYWLGWKRKIEFQSGGEPSFAKLVDPKINIYIKLFYANLLFFFNPSLILISLIFPNSFS